MFIELDIHGIPPGYFLMTHILLDMLKLAINFYLNLANFKLQKIKKNNRTPEPISK